MKYRAKIELYDEHENRVAWDWTDLPGWPAGDRRWPKEVRRLMRTLFSWLRARRDA